MSAGRLSRRLPLLTWRAAASLPRRTARRLPLLSYGQRLLSTVSAAEATSTSPASFPPSSSPPAALTPLHSLLTLVTSHAAPLPLPSSFFSSLPLFQAELRHVHSSHPFFAGSAALHLPSVGSHFTLEVGDVSVILVRGEDQRVRGLFNHCTHQSARICSSSRPDLGRLSRGEELRRALSGGEAEEKQPSSATPDSSPALSSPPKLQTGPTCGVAQRLICPFHHWTFSLSGEHLAPRTALTQDPVQRLHFALAPVKATWEVDGLLLVDCTRRPTPAAPTDRSATDLWEDAEGVEQWTAVRQRVQGRRLRTGGSVLVERNWKAVWAVLMREGGGGVGLFPSLVCREAEGRRWLLQLLPLTPQRTAVTALEATEERREGETESEEVKEKESDDLTSAVQRWMGEGEVDGDGDGETLSGRHRAVYDRWMRQGLSAEVEKEGASRREYERRRNKVLGLS